ncbi:uncharacterized protein METZ01_LOCUS417578, partial [marine metagenome]
HYTEKIVKQYEEKDLVASTRKPGASSRHRPQSTRMEPDCTVEWRGAWYDAKVLKKKPGHWYIHYVDDDDSWNEWVGKDRIRLKKSTAAVKE